MGVAKLDTARRSLWFRGAGIALTTAEFNALAALAARYGQVLTRDELSASLYGREWNGRDRAVDVCIGRLRRKLEERTRGYLEIRSVRGVGYFLINKF